MGDERLENKLPYSHSAVGMLSGLLDVYAEDEGVEKSSLVFTFKGKRIFGHEHPREFNKGTMMSLTWFQQLHTDATGVFAAI